jgi:hypothetical protein
MARAEPDRLTKLEIYKQLCEEFRSLNSIFWRIPTIAMTLNGGVGLALGSVRLTPAMQTALLVFVATCNFSFILILLRLRMQVMEDILRRIGELEHRSKKPGRYRVMMVFTFLLFVAGTFSLSAALFFRETLLPQTERVDIHKVILEDETKTTPSKK